MRAKQLADGLCLVPHDKEAHPAPQKWVSFDSFDDCKQSMQDELTPHLLRIRFHLQTKLDPGWLRHRDAPLRHEFKNKRNADHEEAGQRSASKVDGEVHNMILGSLIAEAK